MQHVQTSRQSAPLWTCGSNHPQFIKRTYHPGNVCWKTNKFQNLPVDGAADAVAQALKLSRDGAEVYFACAEYLTPHSREAANAAGACAFWMDIDCGEDKAASGKGYSTVQGPEEALTQY
jgi:hypothetical protein